MESNQNSTENLQEIVSRNEKFYASEDLNYLYPNGHRITHQMRWFKVSRDRGISIDIAA